MISKSIIVNPRFYERDDDYEDGSITYYCASLYWEDEINWDELDDEDKYY
jgi:hypothetical protein